jgi:threonine synthase
MEPAPARCTACSGSLIFEYQDASLDWPEHPEGMWDYAAVLPLRDRQNIITLGEGGTPLICSRHDFGCRLYWKLESQNPTGSQKDRALSVAISVAHEAGYERVFLVSTGSAGLACAAYAARAGLRCTVIVPENTPSERLLPMQAFGARLVEIKGTVSEIGQMAARLRKNNWYDATTDRNVNPFQAEAPKTIAYEIVAQLGRAPDWVVVPVGGGGTLAGIGQGFRDVLRLGRIDRMPRLACVLPRAFNSLEVALARNLTTQRELAAVGCDESVPTVARNLKCAVPADGLAALTALRQSRGVALSVTDEDAMAGQTAFSKKEGIFCEPSSAVLLPTIERLVADGQIGRDEVVIGIVTGSGLREVSVVGPLHLEQLAPGCDLSGL